MTRAELDRCFEHFAQGDHHRGGLGMGLAISRSIVELLGGRIAVSSPGRGSGTTVTVTLQPAPEPARQAEDPNRAPAAPAEVPALAVLLVEDHEPSRTVLHRVLQRRGHQVTSAATAEQAIAAARDRRFDVVVSDIGLPDQDGYQLMQSLLALQPVAGVAVTGHGREDDVRRALDAGFVAHVTKPVTIQQLNEALAKALAQPQPKAVG